MVRFSTLDAALEDDRFCKLIDDLETDPNSTFIAAFDKIVKRWELFQALQDSGINPLKNLIDIPYLFSHMDGIFKIDVPDTVETLSQLCFSNCNDLQIINFGKNVRIIGTAAFYNCPKLEYVTIPENVQIMESMALSKCTNLKILTILNDDITLGHSMINGCPQCVIRCKANSKAHRYAEVNSYEYELI